MIPTPPLRLRNRLAETILSALGDPAVRRQLEAEDFAWLDDASPEQAATVRARARRASQALAGCRAFTGALDEALAAAAVLFDAGLYFEVHEVLEPHWTRASGDARPALQGLIQIAVAFQHLANGNVDGARSLLADGSARLREGRLAGLDLDRFAGAALAASSHLDDAPALVVPSFPRTLCS
jgi:hypothetical protein